MPANTRTGARRAPPETISLPAWVEFGREVCGDLRAASEREWLVTNGIGGFACGTIAGLLTRRYHGLLFAALKPPVGRTLLVAKLDETLFYGGGEFPLFVNEWAAGVAEPGGCAQIESFRLDGLTPEWHFACGDALLEKRIWMQPGANVTYVRYRVLRAASPVRMDVRALVNYRDYHSATHAGDWRMWVDRAKRGLCVRAFDGAAPIYVLCESATVQPAHEWYRNFELRAERERGLDATEDHLFAGLFSVELLPGESATFVLSTDRAAPLDPRPSEEARLTHERSLLSQFTTANPRAASEAPPWIRQLVLAADQFIVRRAIAGDPGARSVIAGYPWFSDWGRDTMIALPGLTLSTGRAAIARKILRTFARFADLGMLPNVFPDSGAKPEYNSADASLWFFEAVRQASKTGAPAEDDAFLREIFPVLADILDGYQRGTRYSIHADADALLHVGEPGVALTWMDAKAGELVFTPRTGKAVEINALWYNAAMAMCAFARRLGKRSTAYESLAKRVRASFQRFWNEPAGYCFDVIDGPDGDDAALRPNQLLCVSLPESPLTAQQQRGVVDACAQRLLTSYGLRTLDPGHPDYHGVYSGAPRERDAAYHQGTAWAWLLGPFVLAHLRVYEDPALAASFLEPFAHHLRAAGLGSVSEIFDGNAPFAPRGCIAQAWSVAEILRAWVECKERELKG